MSESDRSRHRLILTVTTRHSDERFRVLRWMVWCYSAMRGDGLEVTASVQDIPPFPPDTADDRPDGGPVTGQ